MRRLCRRGRAGRASPPCRGGDGATGWARRLSSALADRLPWPGRARAACSEGGSADPGLGRPLDRLEKRPAGRVTPLLDKADPRHADRHRIAAETRTEIGGDALLPLAAQEEAQHAVLRD